jgi:protein-L-isoaspartate O-methyltransferase
MIANAEGTLAGYARDADIVAARWESIAFTELHHPVLHLIPTIPCRVLDIGAGSGRDAAHLAALGHRVVAVEPTDELRTAAIARHPSPRIEWLDDSLPELSALISRRPMFDLIMLTAVWMHLDTQQRQHAMPRLASMLRIGGTMIMSLRHGALPAGRRMFEVGAGEAIELARAQRLDAVLHTQTASMQPANRLAGVSWTRLAFVKSGETV